MVIQYTHAHAIRRGTKLRVDCTRPFFIKNSLHTEKIPEEENADDDDNGLSVGAILGIIFGCILAILVLTIIIAAIIFALLRKRNADKINR